MEIGAVRRGRRQAPGCPARCHDAARPHRRPQAWARAARRAITLIRAAMSNALVLGGKTAEMGAARRHDAAGADGGNREVARVAVAAHPRSFKDTVQEGALGLGRHDTALSSVRRGDAAGPGLQFDRRLLDDHVLGVRANDGRLYERLVPLFRDQAKPSEEARVDEIVDDELRVDLASSGHLRDACRGLGIRGIAGAGLPTAEGVGRKAKHERTATESERSQEHGSDSHGRCLLESWRSEERSFRPQDTRDCSGRVLGE